MPGSSEGLWYSFNMGPVHFISVSTEVYYFLEYGLKLVIKQYQWLERDLEVCDGNQSLLLHIFLFTNKKLYAYALKIFLHKKIKCHL
jgi:hypothetical protein